MRAGLSTIQQTLTPEAATVLNQSIAEAGRRNHGQTTPLHVAATLLASQSGYLRQACIRSHPNSSHPLQCRALDLCFSVALDRLPSAQNVSPSLEPPISNALMAALKRAQAHQRRGCPEQQQQPLLAVKVELEQLIVSILDDPSVSRVMREASFSSPAVKATIEQALNSSSNSVSNSISSSPIGCGFRPAPTASRNLYMSPRLQQQQQQQQLGNQENHQTGQLQRRDDVKRVVDILLRAKKRNPVLVGESEPGLVLRELLQKIEKREMGEGALKNVRVISLEKELGSDKTQIVSKIKELGDLIDNQISGYTGVIVDLGDLKWLVEQGFGGLGGAPAAQQGVGEAARVAVAEMGKLSARFGEGRGRLWLIGTATCETYLRCQVYHPSMEGDWDLQAVPIAARAPPFQGLFPRIGGNGILSSSVESLSPLKGFPATATALSSRRPNENSDHARRTKCCPLCTQSYERELAKMFANEFEKSSPEAKSEATKQALPQWLQSAKLSSKGNVNTTDPIQTKDKELIRKQKTEELQKKWNDACLRMHPSFHRNASSEIITPAALSMTSMYNSNALSCQTFEPKLQLNRTLGGTLQLSQSPLRNPSPERRTSPFGSPVRTELVLGCTKSSENSPEKGHKENLKDLSRGITLDSIERTPELQKEKVASTLDPDSFKTLCKGLLEKVWWQKEAAFAVVATVIQCRSGNSKRKCFGWKSDTWMLFAGPDRVGKKKMAMALAELLCRSNPITIRLGSRSKDNKESDLNFRGKTTLDRIAEAVQRNPSAVVMLEDIDQADMLVHGSIKRAMERGRLLDSHGREVSIKNVIFILTSSWLPENLKDSSTEWLPCDEEKLANLASREWQLQLSIAAKPRKRRLDWLHEDIRPTKSRTDAVSSTGLSFDLNETAENEEDETAEGSRNSSDLTFEHDQEHVLMNKCLQSPATSPVVSELFKSVDDAIVFKPVDFGPLRTKVAGAISSMFSTIVDNKRSIEVDKEALERIVGGIWFGQTKLEEWIEKVLVSSFKSVKNSLTSTSSSSSSSSSSGGGGAIEEDPMVVRLVSVGDSSRRSSWDWLPSKVTVNTEGS